MSSAPELTSPPARATQDPPFGHLSGADLGVAALLALLSFSLYIPSLSNHFVDYDDHHYVTANKVVQQGMTREGVVWAFTTTKFANWLPVTWLSHMLDCELFGLNAGGHHGTSAALHAFNAVALFFALRMMTGRFWPAAAVAALFAFHPLRVESVSWVAERKDVLCGTFFMLALLAYTAYSRRPSTGRYLAVLACHALGLMSKTMLVTLPCLLLLLDYWPLRRFPWAPAEPAGDGDGPPEPRFARRGTAWLVAEKLPLVLLSIVSSAWTFVFQSTGGAMSGTRDLTLPQRLGNAFVSVPRYLYKIIWPADLSAFYPHPGSWPPARVAGAVALVLVLSVGAAALYRRRPYVAVGWFWFLGMLVPVSGIIQVGLQSMADRYTYLPGIGLLVALAWWASDLLRRRPRLVAPAAIATAIALGAMSVATLKQQRHWENTYTLFKQAAAVDPRNWLALNMIGSVYSANADRAFARGDNVLGRALSEEAVAYYQRSLAVKADHFTTLHNYGWSLYRLGRLGDAIPYLEGAVKLDPDNANGRVDLAEVLVAAGRTEDAVRELKEAVRLNPGHKAAQRGLEQLSRSSTRPATRPATRPSTQPAR